MLGLFSGSGSSLRTRLEGAPGSILPLAPNADNASFYLVDPPMVPCQYTLCNTNGLIPATIYDR